MELFVFWILMAVICGMVASSKGSSFIAFFFYGVVIWPIALVHALLMKRVDTEPVHVVPLHGAMPAKVQTPSAPESPRKAQGVIAGTPFWRSSGGGYCAEINGREIEFPSMEMLEAALTGKSVR